MRLPFENSLHSVFLSLLARFGVQESEFWRIFRYLLAGGWNTVFGIGVYALLVMPTWGREHYLLMLVPANIIAITNAFVCYKLFVFKTQGNWLREYLKCYVVYAGGIGLSFVLMYLLVDLLGLHPVVAQCVCVALTTVCSYLGHKLFSFKACREKREASGA